MPLRRLTRAMLAASLLVALLGAGPVAAADDPLASPTPAPTTDPTPDVAPSADPSPSPVPTVEPTPAPTPDPTAEPTPDPSAEPTPDPTVDPSVDPSPTASPDPSPTPVPMPAWTGRFNLYRYSAWVRQYRNYTCTAASTQTMINLIRGRSDRSLLLQMRIIRYARQHDSLRWSAGSDPEGWARAVTYFGGGPYRWRVFDTRTAALRYAAKRMMATGKPVGLLVWKGRHAWTMTGFTARSDPRTDPAVVVTGVYVAPPLLGVDPRPNAYLTVAALGKFARYQERDGLRAWVGHWVVVAP